MCSIIRSSPLLYLLVFLLTTGAGFSSAVHSQNPFDIKKRMSPAGKETQDSIQLDSTDSPVQSVESPLPEIKENEEEPAILPPSLHETPESRDGIKNKNLSIRPDASSDDSYRFPPWWFYVFDLVLLLLIAGVFLYDKTIFPLIRKAFIHENFLRFLYRDTYLRKPGIFMFMNIIFILGLGFILFRLSNHYGFETTFRHYLLIQGLTLFLFTFKYVALYLLSILADKPFEIRFYQYWMILASGYIGLWMVPLVLMISVLPSPYIYYALIISFLLLAAALIYRLIKALLHARIYLSKHFLQIFLYFCAIEIIPILIFLEILTV